MKLRNVMGRVLGIFILVTMLVGLSSVVAKGDEVSSQTASLSTPTGLTLYNPKRDTVALEWNNVSGATSYRVYISTVESNGYHLIPACPTSNKIVITGLNAYTVYYFKVSAWNGVSESTLSTSVSGKSNIIGVDVSYHNEIIDWDKVKATGIVDFAIIRIGYGDNITNQDDTKYYYNIEQCDRVGMPTGYYIYSYATNTAMASSEADHMNRLLGYGGRKAPYGIWYDMEDSSTLGLASSVYGDMAETFHNKVANYGYQVGIYANKYWFTSILTDSRFNNWVKWVAQYNDECTYDGVYIMWQNTSSGQISGINGNVDMNYAFTGRTRDYTNATSYDIRNGLTDPLVAPSTVSAQAVGGNNVYLSWSQSKGAYRYDIYRSTSKDGTYSLIGYSAYLYWTDLNAKEYQNYYYKIKVNSSYGDYVYTSPVLARTYISTVSPEHINATYNSISVSWNKLSTADYYEVYRSTKEDTGFSKIAETSSTNYKDNNVTYGLAYYYRIKGVKKASSGLIRSVLSDSLKGRAVLGSVQYITPESNTYNSIKISIMSIDGATRYHVYRSTSENGTYKLIGTTTTTTYIDKNLVTNTRYYYKVCAVYVYNGKNMYSGTSSASSAVPELNKVSYIQTTSSSNGITVAWSEVLGATGYYIERSTSSTGTYTIVGKVYDRKFVDTTAVKGQAYFYRIKPYRNVNGVLLNGKWSNYKYGLKK